MGAETKSGAAAPAAEPANQSAGADFPRATMEKIFARHGQKLPPLTKTTEGSEGGEKKKPAPAEGQAAAVKPAEAGTAAGAEAEAKVTAGEGAAAEGGEGGGEGAAAVETEGGEAGAGEGAAPVETATGAEGEKPDEATAAETERIVKAKLKDLPEPQRKIAQSIINERIGAISAKSKAETERLGSRVVELTSELEAARSEKPAVIQGVHPAMLAEKPEQIDAYKDDLDRQEDMLEQYRESGIEADEARGVPAFTAEQVRARLREIRRERERVLPEARTLLQKRAETETALRTSFPALFDPRTEEYRAAAALRKQLPELRRLPEATAFVAKLVLGAKALADLQAPAGGKKTAATAAAPEKKVITQTVKKAPRAPGDGSAGLGSVLDDPRIRQPDTGGALKNVTANPRSREALKSAIRTLVFR